VFDFFLAKRCHSWPGPGSKGRISLTLFHFIPYSCVRITNLSHFIKNVFQNFEVLPAIWLEVSKNCLYDLKTSSSQNLSKGNKKAQNFMPIFKPFPNSAFLLPM
jgi:hypothetical protein